MKNRLSIFAFTPIFFLLPAGGAVAQTNWFDKTCETVPYSANEVTRRARIVEGPDFSGVREVFRNFHGRVRVNAVLCRSGRVTDISVIEGSSPTVNEFVSAAVSMIRFVPAELNLHSVSQTIQFEFGIDDGKVKVTVPQSNGPLVESVTVSGNRRFTAKQILGWIRTRAGESYDEIQVKRDFDAILSTGHFDKLTSRVFIEDGLRGGVGVFFEVFELPLISDVAFEGLKIDPAIIKEAWKAAHISLEKGGAYSPDIGQAAIRVLKQVLDQKAPGYSKVEMRGELLNAQTINLTFVITDR